MSRRIGVRAISRLEAVELPLEGNYTTWTLQWKKDCVDDWGGVFRNLQTMCAYETENKLLFVAARGDCIVTDLEGIFILRIIGTQPYYYPNTFFSALQKYVVQIQYEGIYKAILKIFKNGSVIQSIDLVSVCGWNNDSNKYATISSNGKYIAVADYTTDEVALFKGS